MSVRIASTIFKSRLSRNGTWVVSTAATDPTALPADRYVLGTCDMAPTFTAAIELDHAQRVELDAELMESVHESRSRRRPVVIDATDDYDAELHTMEATA